MNNKTLHAGSLLKRGEYRIIETLGQGGFGITYLAEQTGLGRRVAVKEFFMKDLCNRDGATSEVSVPSTGSSELVGKFKQKFLREARMIAALDNPHIVRIHDVFEENGTAYYVMEHLGGGSLSEKVRQSGPMPQAEALGYIRQVADALAYLHSRNILHFDVKPSNILLGQSGQAVLIDFGISKHYDEAGSQTSSTPVGISKGYAPMEQYQQSEISTFTPATDIYSLGATLYFLLLGQTPPSASEVNEDGLPPLPGGIDATTREAVVKAMAPRRRERPQSVREFLRLLDASAPAPTPVPAVEVEEETVGPDEARPRKPRPKQTKSRGGLALRSILFAVIFIGAGSFIYHLVSRPETETLEELQPEILDSVAVLPSSSPASAPAKQYGTLKVESTPAGATIWIDGRNTKKTTPDIFEEVTPGSHKVVLKLDGYADASKSVSVQGDKRTNCSLTLTARQSSAAPAPASPSASSSRADSGTTDLGNGWRKTRSGTKTTYTNGSVSFTLVAVAGGTFKMGATSEQRDDADDREKPAHDVTVRGFSIGETEVTQALWQAVMGSNPSRTGDMQCPVENVSYSACKSFINKLNSLTGQSFRLPTEAEWEFAARGGRSSRNSKYSGHSTIDNVAWYSRNSGRTTHPVKTKSPNELGLYDMSGNVWEWCNDWYDSDYYNNSTSSNPRGPQSGSCRVYRGGGWECTPERCRVACRGYASPGNAESSLGFRLAQ